MNAEYAWGTLDRYAIGRGSGLGFASYANASIIGMPAGLRTPQFAVIQHAFAELGVMAGPSRTTLMWAWALARNLNGGPVTTFQQDSFGAGAVGVPTGSFNTTSSGIWAINYQAMDPYNTLMFPDMPVATTCVPGHFRERRPVRDDG